MPTLARHCPRQAIRRAGGGPDEELRPRAYLENLRRVLPVLRANGVHEVTVSFDGSGDSGSIDDVSYGGAPIDGAALSMEIDVLNRVSEAGQWVTSRALETKDLNTAIEELTGDYLAETNVDWYNNDGGFGEFTINVDEGTVALEVSVRFTESPPPSTRALGTSSPAKKSTRRQPQRPVSRLAERDQVARRKPVPASRVTFPVCARYAEPN